MTNLVIRALSAVATGVVVATLVLVTPGIPTASAATTCPTVFFMGARGSGEPSGFGAVISDVNTRFKDQIGTAATVEDFAIPYPAVPITLTEASEYPSSVQAGADSAVSFIRQTNEICPKSVFVLSGWSQGADVVASAMDQVAGLPIWMPGWSGPLCLGIPSSTRTRPQT